MSYQENIFTKIINKEIPSEVVLETDSSIIIKDKFPQAKVHWLVLPKGFYTDLNDFLSKASSEEILDFMGAINTALNKLKNAKVQFNIGKDAGQEIFHLHAHIISDEDI